MMLAALLIGAIQIEIRFFPAQFSRFIHRQIVKLNQSLVVIACDLLIGTLKVNHFSILPPSIDI